MIVGDQDDCEYGIACNHTGDSAIPEGAKCYVTWDNRGGGCDRMRVWVRSRGGRAIQKIVDSRKLYNFRVKWFPDYIRNWNRGGCAGFTKEEAARRLDWILSVRPRAN